MFGSIKKFVVASVLGLSAVAMIGCGGSGSSTLSNADFGRQANQICDGVNRQVASLPPVKTISDISTEGPKELGYLNGALAKLQALKAPAAKQAAFSQYLTHVRQETGLVNQLEAAAKSQNVAQIKAVALAGQGSSQQAHAQATQLGLTECAKNAPQASSR